MTNGYERVDSCLFQYEKLEVQNTIPALLFVLRFFKPVSILTAGELWQW